MRGPSAAELAAIAAAYVILAREAAPQAASPSRWRLADRTVATPPVWFGRTVPRISRWRAAARDDG